MRRLILLLVAALPIAAGAATPKPSIYEREERALATELARRTPGKPALCVNQMRLNGPESVGDHTIVYRQSAKRIWVSQLREKCPSLRGDRIIVVEAFGTQICRNDRFQVLPRGSTIAFGSCFFGPFTPYDKVAAR